jgi:hypothetical protein
MAGVLFGLALALPGAGAPAQGATATQDNVDELC